MFFSGFFACIIKGKGWAFWLNYWWAFRVIWHRGLPSFLESHVVQYLNKILQFIQSIISWPFWNFQTMWHMFYGCFYWRVCFCDLRVKCYSFFTRRIFFKCFLITSEKVFVIFISFQISDGKILVTCDAIKYFLTVVTFVIVIRKLIKSTKKKKQEVEILWNGKKFKRGASFEREGCTEKKLQ